MHHLHDLQYRTHFRHQSPVIIFGNSVDRYQNTKPSPDWTSFNSTCPQGFSVVQDLWKVSSRGRVEVFLVEGPDPLPLVSFVPTHAGPDSRRVHNPSVPLDSVIGLPVVQTLTNVKSQQRHDVPVRAGIQLLRDKDTTIPQARPSLQESSASFMFPETAAIFCNLLGVDCRYWKLSGVMCNMYHL